MIGVDVLLEKTRYGRWKSGCLHGGIRELQHFGVHAVGVLRDRASWRNSACSSVNVGLFEKVKTNGLSAAFILVAFFSFYAFLMVLIWSRFSLFMHFYWSYFGRVFIPKAAGTRSAWCRSSSASGRTRR